MRIPKPHKDHENGTPFFVLYQALCQHCVDAVHQSKQKRRHDTVVYHSGMQGAYF